MSVNEAIENAAASVEMEGYHINDECKMWCSQLLKNEITFDEYMNLVKKQAGVRT